MRTFMTSDRLRRCVAIGLGVSGVSGVFAISAEATDKSNSASLGISAPQHRYYFKEHRALALDPARIALRAADGASRATIQSAGLRADGIEPLPVSGWELRQVLASNPVAADVQRLLVALQAENDGAFFAPVFIGDDGGPVIPTGDVLVQFSLETDADTALEILATLVPGAVRDFEWGGLPNAYRVAALSRNGWDVLAAANTLAERPEVIFAEPDYIFTGRSDLIPNDTFFNQCWGLHNTGQSGGVPDMDMDAPEAWDITTGDPSIKVVIIDTGVQQNHPDLNQVPGFDATGNNSGGGPVNNCDNHGTAVAGCVSAIINNSIGVVGVAPGCKSASARSFNSNLSCDGTWTAQGSWTVDSLNWAQSIGARVSNNSNYYGFTSAAIEQKYADSRAAGMVHFASAGNNGSGTIGYPASIDGVNSVAALDRNGNRASFSQYGPGLDFSAPGVTIYSTDRTSNDGYVAGDYVVVNGTSFASPYAAGAAALVLSINPALSAAQVETILQQSSIDRGPAGYDTEFGWGFVNAYYALLSFDCNGNSVPDSQDIANGTSQDCNGNNIPDECDIANAIPAPVGPRVNPANGHTYYLIGPSSWIACEAAAVARGGHLATINDAAENTFIYDNFAYPYRALWIGLNDIATEGTFAWTSGEPVSYTNWASPSEPSDNDGTHDYGIIHDPHYCVAQGIVQGVWADEVPGFVVWGVLELPFQDCNGNMFDDACEIADGFAQDCNQNGVPDTCDIVGENANPIVADLARDFSTAGNPIAGWRFGSAPNVVSPALELFLNNTSFSPPLQSWSLDGTGGPFVATNPTNLYHVISDTQFLPHSVSLHPGCSPDRQITIAETQAPSSGRYHIHAKFNGRSNSTDVTAMVVLGDQVVHSQNISGILTASVYSAAVNLHAGQRIRFAVGWGPNGNCNSDTTAVSVTVRRIATDCDVDSVPDSCQIPTRLYVKQGATGTGDGESWTNALPHLQDALALAACNFEIGEIWVAEGTYRPDETTANSNGNGDRNATFQLRDGLLIIGGFRGLPGDEGFSNNTTRPLDGVTGRPILQSILSGDLAENDGPAAFQDYSENSYHVVVGSSTNASAELSGVTVRAGFASGAAPRDQGAGIYCSAGSPTIRDCSFLDNSTGGANDYGGGAALLSGSNATFNNCLFQGNRADYGGGLFSNSSSPTVLECTFTLNVALLDGGGVVHENSGTMTMSDCTFSTNSAARFGGAMQLQGAAGALISDCTFSDNAGPRGGALQVVTTGTITLGRCTFLGNAASIEGGGVYSSNATNQQYVSCRFLGNTAQRGGAVYRFDGWPNFINCLFSGNQATPNDGGGALFISGTAPFFLINCTLSRNSAAGSGGGIWNQNSIHSATVINNCIFWGNIDDADANAGGPYQDETAQFHNNAGTPTLNFCNLQGGWSGAGTGNINANPNFVDADSDDMRLGSGSPCIDAANNSNVTVDFADLDADGNTAEPTPLDLAGNPRFLDATCVANTGVPGNGYTQVVDMGAYEFVEPDCDNDGIGDVCDSNDFIEITAQPQSQTVCAAEPVAFGVNAAGAPPISYQWRRNGIALIEGSGSPYGGVNQNVLLVNPASSSVAGSYDVVITGTCGEVTSEPAILTVTIIPGDINESGEVDIADLTGLLSNFGALSGASFASGDLDGDDDVDLNDLTAMLSAFGSQCL